MTTPNDIRMMIADVDGTLVTQEKVLTERAIAAVHMLHDAGILFAVTSGRPPRGMSMLIDPLKLTTPISGFNGGIVVDREMNVIDQKVIQKDLVKPMFKLLKSMSLDVWVYQGAKWYVGNRKAPHVDREAWTVKFEPIVEDDIESITENVAKIVGVSDDLIAIQNATEAAHKEFGSHVSAEPSQPYYLDITHPEANKGSTVEYLAAKYNIPSAAIATIGDMPTDVLMFERSGVGIAMGNAKPDVQKAARDVTLSNEQEGFAVAVERFILGLS